MAGVSDGQHGNASTLNAAFMARNGDTSTTGAVNLASAATADGTAVTSSQREHNSIASYVGKALNGAKNLTPTWASDIIGSAGQAIQARVESIVQLFRDTAAHGGHTHSGVDGQGPLIPMASLSATGTPGATNYLRGDGAWAATSGGGQGGINFLTLDSAWDDSVTDSSDFDASVGNWAAYADAAASSPADMTGGSPTTTFARTTTAGEVLNGTGAGKLVKDAANRQGEGAASVAYIPLAYRTSRIYYEFAYKVISGTYATDDLQTFIYDVTNSQVITPFRQSKMVNGQGVAFGYFDIQSTTAQIRFGLHVASTSASAYTVAIDDVKVTPTARSFSVPVSDWTSDRVFTTQGLGTPTATSFWSRRVGDSLQVRGTLLSGTATAANLAIVMPGGIAIDTAKSGSAYQYAGEGQVLAGTADYVTTDGTHLHAIISNASSSLVYLTDSRSTGAEYGLRLANGIVASGNRVTFNFTVPISGWSSNVQMADSASFKISSYLANGTRVTGSAPTALGQYRSYLRNASASTFTETNGSPTAAPSNADGMRLYNGNAYSAADTNNEPTKYEIFVGKNKSVSWLFYASAGRTGNVDVTPYQVDSTTVFGYHKGYDPTTGIAWIAPNYNTGSETSHTSGRSGPATGVNDPYFDLIVSENALSIGVESVRSEVRVDTANGYGSTNTKIRRFTTTTKSTGTAITYTDSATNGASFTINEDGVYAYSYRDDFSGANNFGISKNSTQLTTGPAGITATDVVDLAVAPNANQTYSVAGTVTLSAGDVLRMHTDGGTTGSVGRAMFRITQVNK